MTEHSASLPFIATRELTGVDSIGRQFPVKLGIGQPYQEGADWPRKLASSAPSLTSDLMSNS